MYMVWVWVSQLMIYSVGLGFAYVFDRWITVVTIVAGSQLVKDDLR